MSFLFHHLDTETRRFMLQEVQNDIDNNSLYMSTRFNSKGHRLYPQFIVDAVQNQHERWLADQLANNDCFMSHEGAKARIRATPHTAAQTLADGEFNTFYMRGLCVRAEEEEIPQLMIYRAKEVASPRSSSHALIGRHIDPTTAIRALRRDPHLRESLLGAPNSGLSLQFPAGYSA